MWLAVDSGNTRVKWALIENGRIIAQAATVKTRPRLPVDKRIQAVRVAHVGTAADLQRLQKALTGRRHVQFIRPRRVAAGMTNAYRPPQALGVDRWLCLLAAYQLPATRRRGAVVISAGTAITIDVLSAAGTFLGGIILPGLALMPAALARATPLPRVDYRQAAAILPQNTAAAIGTGGALAAAASALALRRRHLPGARLLLTGGDAPLLQPHLPAALLKAQLLFDGMICLTQPPRGAKRA